jgi:hypothetical protein
VKIQEISRDDKLLIATRSALYANKVNTLFLKNLNDTESFGFAPNQVTPFILRTPDNESLYAWHVLPADVYAENERELRSETRPFAPVADITSTIGFRLLTSKEGPPARVVVYCTQNTPELPSSIITLIILTTVQSTETQATLAKTGARTPTVTWPHSPTPTS